MEKIYDNDEHIANQDSTINGNQVQWQAFFIKREHPETGQPAILKDRCPV